MTYVFSTVLACFRPLSNCPVPSKAAYSRIQLNLIMYADNPLPISSSSKPWQNAPGQGACNNAITQEDRTRNASNIRQDGRCQFCINLAIPIVNSACMGMESRATASKNVCCFCVQDRCASTITSSISLSYEMPTHLHAVATTYYCHDQVAHLQKLQG